MKRIMLCGLTILFMVTGVSCTMTSKDPNTSATEITEPSWFSSSQMEDPNALEDILSRIDNETPYQELITKEIDVHLFMQKYDPNLSKTATMIPRLITQIDHDFGVECLRKTEAGALYSVHKMKQGGLLYVFYRTKSSNEAGKYVEVKSLYCVKKKLCYADFSSVEKGTSLKKVTKIDPVTQIYADRDYAQDILYMQYSCHYLEDGILLIGYADENGKLVVDGTRYYPDFQVDLVLWAEEKIEPYDGHILPIDRIDS